MAVQVTDLHLLRDQLLLRRRAAQVEAMLEEQSLAQVIKNRPKVERSHDKGMSR